jgi:hypothetical protein
MASSTRTARTARTARVNQSAVIQGALNIVDTIRSATAAQWAAGIGWYRSFYGDCTETAHSAGIPGEDAIPGSHKWAGIAAAFSIQRNPNANLKHVYDFIVSKLFDDYIHPNANFHTSVQDAKAEAIWNGANPADVLTGPKENAFYHNIIGEYDYVTIDGHAWACFVGEYIHTDKVSVPSADSPRREECRLAYVKAAELLGIKPAQAQAVAWVAWRDKHQSAKVKKQRTTKKARATIA